ncbi:HlyD family type I secretion periplasmic adaptor subunit [Photobacterium sanguinicancri]|uniref:Membrane fusion protein (MFP) family protein n=1 Tax=Photobacterium sanguinicancri TaxID=875932 RepID=A0AAW7XYZ3_9GAMM|nr:HlyD family type I secretion periplasmic adaptor subunit [Photobacterium sanguinicancri]KXI21258.1 hemolysin D [Photobacterium sanguinicancri]MDO6541538.1 HlyD family type I secretion periplasmic adaptor subunit [Photobacterium sanguinicancri]OZS45951.1 HlyD family type I secretion periplasmic adaptor subunit [Photobacterium sanguinicancri]
MGIENHIKKALIESKQNDGVETDHSIYIQSAMTTVHKSLLFLFIALLLLIALASRAQIDIVVSSRGEMLLDSDIERVQHLEGGILDTLLVQAGDYVYAGQPIARLKSVDRATQFQSATIDIIGLEMEIARYQGLINQTKPDYSRFSVYPQLVTQQTESWQKEFQKNTSNQELIALDIKHKQRLIGSMKKRINSSRKQLGLIRKQLSIKETLYKEEMASYVDVLNMQVQETNMIREIENLSEAVMSEQFQSTRLEKQLNDTIANRNAGYQTQINQLEKDRSLKQAQLPQHADKVDRLTVYSPVDGVVDKVHFNFKSAVIPPNESIADIAPIRNSLHGEAKIPKKDMGFVEIGQEVKLKFDTYNFAKYGFVTGTIDSISRSSYKEEENEFYIAKISIQQNFLEKSGATYTLSPYMEFTADIKTGSRYVIDYALKPVMSAMEDAFDER